MTSGRISFKATPTPTDLKELPDESFEKRFSQDAPCAYSTTDDYFTVYCWTDADRARIDLQWAALEAADLSELSYITNRANDLLLGVDLALNSVDAVTFRPSDTLHFEYEGDATPNDDGIRRFTRDDFEFATHPVDHEATPPVVGVSSIRTTTPDTVDDIPPAYRRLAALIPDEFTIVATV